MIKWNGAGPCICAVLLLNCDPFKQIKDAFGHAVGDQRLCIMAERLQATLQEYDLVSMRGKPHEQLTGRIGSDKFVMLLERIRRQDDVDKIAARLLAQLAASYRVDGIKSPTTSAWAR